MCVSINSLFYCYRQVSEYATVIVIINHVYSTKQLEEVKIACVYIYIYKINNHNATSIYHEILLFNIIKMNCFR